MLDKTETHRLILEPMLIRSCDLIDREQYRQSLTTLRLLNSPTAALPEASSVNAKHSCPTKYAQVNNECTVNDVYIHVHVDALNYFKITFLV